MQYDLLIVIFIIILILLIYKHLYSIYFRFKWKKRREKEDIYNIYKMFEDEFTYEDFRETWINIANTLGLDAEKIRPNDNLYQLERLYPFPEIPYDDIEELLIKYRIDFKDIKKTTTISDIVKIICLTKQTRKL